MSSDFTGLYQVSETLTFELRPVGKTGENLKNSGLLEQDLKRAEDYPEVKKFLDEQHKQFLEKVLSEIDIDWAPLAQKITEFQKNKELKSDLEKLQDKFRKDIADKFSKDELYPLLVKEATPSKLFKSLLEKSSGTAEEIKTFARFACYFKGFQENRRNIYSADAQQTAAAYRAVNENFSKFFNAVNIFSTIINNYPCLLTDIRTRTAVLLNGSNVEDFFKIESYNKFLAQSGIDFFNNVIGEINYTINQYRQQHKEITSKNLPFLPTLYKQILSDREKAFTINSFSNDAELRRALMDFADSIGTTEMFGEKVELFSALQRVFTNINANDDLFVNAKYLEKISVKTAGQWNAFKEAMSSFAEKNIKSKSNQKKYCEKSVFAFNDIASWDVNKICDDGSRKPVDFTDFWRGAYSQQLFDTEKSLYPQFVQIIVQNDDIPLREKEDSVKVIKDYLDAVQEIYHLLKPLIADPEYGGDQNLQSVLVSFNDKLEQIVPLYNQTRNYITKKATDVSKMKLMFNSSTMADGWDLNKEKDNLSVILKKGNNYYLAIINPEAKPKVDFADFTNEIEPACYEKMVYKLLPGPNKMLPKVFFSKKGIETFAPDAELLRRYQNKEHIKGENFSLSFCHELIDFFKRCIAIHPDWSKFGFRFSSTESYNGIDEFYKEISEQGYSVNFVNIPESSVQKLVDEGKIFLFQIWNKDFSSKSTGTPNKFTLYWKTLFNPRNLVDVVFKLNGEAELFLREQAIPPKVTHAAGSKLLNKTVVVDIDQNARAIRQAIPEEIHQELYSYINGKKTQADLSKESCEYLEQYPLFNWQTGMPISNAVGKLIVKDAPFDMVKDKRFTEEKYFFHVPITINFKSPKEPVRFNDKVLAYLKDNPDVNIIGLDRGERNLIYLVLMNQRGEILEQRSLNLLNGVDYHGKLDLREKERNNARKSWNSIGQIKDLKTGYLSGVIYEIAKMMVEHNAIVVMEDLNSGFKRGRMKIEKQIYQNFEKALIEKLNYLVFKNERELNAPGGVLSGYQLAGKFESFKRLGKQCGFIFYVPAGFTSKIDPATGFVNIFDFNDCTGAESIKDFFENFESVRYVAEKNAFAFKFDYRKFKTHQSDYQNIWTVFSLSEAWQQEKDNSNGKYSAVSHNPTKEIKDAITRLGENVCDDFDLLSLIHRTAPTKTAASFFKAIFYAFRMSVALRHSNRDKDMIISPVMDENGQFFDSGKVKDNSAPHDADANGAFHIALKGLYLLKHGIIDGKLEKIPHDAWMKFTQSRNK